jgi:hypothetical protein
LARCPSWRLGSTLSFGVSLQSTGLTPNQEDIHLEMDLGPALLDVVGVQGLLSWSMLHPMCQATMQLSNSKAPLGANFSFGQSFLVVAGLRTGCSSMDYKIVAHAPCACKCQKRSTICCSPVYSVKKYGSGYYGGLDFRFSPLGRTATSPSGSHLGNVSTKISARGLTP